MAATASAGAQPPAPLADEKHDQVEAQWRQPQTVETTKRPDIFDVATCSNPGARQSSPPPQQQRKKAKRKNDSLSASLCAAIVQHQLGLSINIILLLVLSHAFFPTLRPRTTPFFTLSYHDADTGLYNQGWDDFRFVVFWIIVFTGLRAATMDYVLVPFARWQGITKKKATVRYSEQAWLLIYYCVFWGLGMYLMCQSPYFFNLPALWSNFPTRSMTGLFKWYYLVQFAFWLQQIVVVHIEERRKDHWQMFAHHVITCALVFGSYGYYQTKVGNLILCLMDVVDIIFPAAKLLKYAGYQKLCDIAFGVFIVSWFVARHVFYLAVCWSIYVDVPVEMPYGCYNVETGVQTSLDGGSDILSNVMHAYTNTGSDVCFNSRIHYTFLALLLALQVITIVWFGMICRVAYRVLSGKGADDTRSDDEGDEELDEGGDEEAAAAAASRDLFDDQAMDFAQKEPELALRNNQPFLEEEVGVEDLRFTNTRRTSASKRSASGGSSAAPARRSKGRASGISIPGHGDHKELLGRIGCDKPT
ncbi:hypothetical protein MBLNU459_g7793t1 [Dothideomycetes sp. NU459]